jgi:hypothetical protein
MIDIATSGAIAAVAAAISAFLTLIIAVANYRSGHAGANAADVENCLAVVNDLGEAERRVRDAPLDSDIRTWEFRALLNLLEALALLVNERKIAPSTGKITTEYLEESWAFLDADESNRTLIEESLKSPETFNELKRFAKQHYARISLLRDRYRKELAARNEPAPVANGVGSR